jgi:hypothetical protein
MENQSGKDFTLRPITPPQRESVMMYGPGDKVRHRIRVTGRNHITWIEAGREIDPSLTQIEKAESSMHCSIDPD